MQQHQSRDSGTNTQQIPEQLRRAVYNEIKADAPNLDWQKFDMACDHATQQAGGRGGGDDPSSRVTS